MSLYKEFDDPEITNLFVKSDWIYFGRKSITNEKTFEVVRMKTDSSVANIIISEKNTVVTGKLFAVYQDWIYYYSGQSNEMLVRIRTDGSSRQVIIQGTVAFDNVAFLGGKLITVKYLDQGSEQFTSDLDGSARVPIAK